MTTKTLEQIVGDALELARDLALSHQTNDRASFEIILARTLQAVRQYADKVGGEIEALNDMLESARREYRETWEALSVAYVAYEPHQCLHERVLEAARRIQPAERASGAPEIEAWRERFPQYEYRAQDECIVLRLDAAPTQSTQQLDAGEPVVLTYNPVYRTVHEGRHPSKGFVYLLEDAVTVPAPQVAQIAEGEPIYQIRALTDKADCWQDREKTACDLAVAQPDIFVGRIVFGTPPQQPAAESDDTVRLDFLHKCAMDRKMGWHIGFAPAGLMRVTQIGRGTTTIREAIDAVLPKSDGALPRQSAAPPPSPIADSGDVKYDFLIAMVRSAQDHASAAQDRVIKLRAALEEMIDVAERVDSWQSFPSAPIDKARAALAAQPKADSGVGE